MLSQVLSLPRFSSNSYMKDIKWGAGDMKAVAQLTVEGLSGPSWGACSRHMVQCAKCQVRQASWRRWHLSWALKDE